MTSFPVDDLRRDFRRSPRAAISSSSTTRLARRFPQTVLGGGDRSSARTQRPAGGPYRRSQEVDAMIARARDGRRGVRQRTSPREIAFGLNATSFIRVDQPRRRADARRRAARSSSPTSITRRTSRPGWRSSGSARGSSGGRPEDDGALHAADLEPLVSQQTRLVACTVASNAIGTRVDVAAAARRRARGWRGVVSRCGAFRAAWADRRAGVGLRLPGLLRLQDLLAAYGLRMVPHGGDRRVCRHSVRISSRIRRPTSSKPARTCTRTSPGWRPSSRTSSG